MVRARLDVWAGAIGCFWSHRTRAIRSNFSGSSGVASRNRLLHSGVAHSAKSPLFHTNRAYAKPRQAFASEQSAALDTANFGEFFFHALR